MPRKRAIRFIQGIFFLQVTRRGGLEKFRGILLKVVYTVINRLIHFYSLRGLTVSVYVLY